MKTHHKIFGNPLKTYIEISIDFTRWLIGFGWAKLTYSIVPSYVHFNLGPFALIIGWRK